MDNPPFGHYTLPPLSAALLRMAQRLPVSKLGRWGALGLRWLVRGTGAPVIDATVRDLRLRLYPDDNVADRKFLFMPQFYDQVEFNLIERVLPADGVFLDIGANIGLYSLWAAVHMGPQGRVLSAEPHPLTLQRLRQNIALNGMQSRVTVLPVALSDSDGEMALHLAAGNLGGSSLACRMDDAKPIMVSTRPLSAVLAEQGVTHIDILKIDVEGFEPRILMPFLVIAPDSLLPRYMIIEQSQDKWRDDLPGALRKRGVS